MNMLTRNTIEVETFKDMSFAGMKLPMITVYDKPDDFPYQFVARLWDLKQPTPYAALRFTFKEIKEIMPDSSFLVGRRPEDDPNIVGTWIVRYVDRHMRTPQWRI